MSLLTKEQEATVEQVRSKLREDEGWGGRGGYESSLITIIDDLQAREPKQYTEQELREEFGKRYSIRPGYEKSAFAPWIECAAFVGALKAGP